MVWTSGLQDKVFQKTHIGFVPVLPKGADILLSGSKGLLLSKGKAMHRYKSHELSGYFLGVATPVVGSARLLALWVHKLQALGQVVIVNTATGNAVIRPYENVGDRSLGVVRQYGGERVEYIGLNDASLYEGGESLLVVNLTEPHKEDKEISKGKVFLLENVSANGKFHNLKGYINAKSTTFKVVPILLMFG